MIEPHDDQPRAACVGEWDLFDSTDLGDHELARMICLGCPILDECADRLAMEPRDLRLGPTGTWAGTLHGSNHPPVNSREESSYTEDEAHEAWKAWRRGNDKSAWAEAGHRVHERRRKRVTRKVA